MLSDVIGAIATTLVFISFLPKKMELIRGINLLGSVAFVVYGIQVNATWTAIMNMALIFVNLYHLIKLKKQKGATDGNSQNSGK